MQHILPSHHARKRETCRERATQGGGRVGMCRVVVPHIPPV